MRTRWPLRGRRAAEVLAALAVLAGVGTWAATGDDGPGVARDDRVFEMPEEPGSRQTVRIDTSLFTAGDAAEPRPAVLLAHGFGGSKEDVRPEAERLARAGYAVLTWSARGFGGSTGRIGLNDPEREVADVSRLIDWLAERPDIRLDGDGDPRVGVAGSSYGGAIALLAAGHDDRVDAIAPRVTYWDLAEALFPQGVFKRLWTGILFTTGSTEATTGSTADDPGCGRFLPELCALYERVAVAGAPDEAARHLLHARSPAAVADRIDVPTLITQGQHDSLFPLDQADAMAGAIEANGAPVSVDWVWAGHDGGISEAGRTEERTIDWFDRYLRDDPGADTGPGFRVTRISGFDSTNGSTLLRGASGDAYPGLDGESTAVELTGGEQSFVNPPGGAPPGVSAVPGLGSLARISTLGLGLALDFPGQYASFDSAPLDRTTRVTGAPSVRIDLSSDAESAVLFAKLYDVAPDGGSQSLPAQLVAPIRVDDIGEGRTVDVRLPTIDYPFEAGHRMRVVLATTDLGYASPNEPATHTVSLADPALTVPTAPELVGGSPSLPWWVWGLPLGGAVVAAALLLTGRRRAPAGTAAPVDP
ncbi:alpha/beta fold hydrolase, partial [Streptomyces hainanensis]